MSTLAFSKLRHGSIWLTNPLVAPQCFPQIPSRTARRRNASARRRSGSTKRARSRRYLPPAGNLCCQPCARRLVRTQLIVPRRGIMQKSSSSDDSSSSSSSSSSDKKKRKKKRFVLKGSVMPKESRSTFLRRGRRRSHPFNRLGAACGVAERSALRRRVVSVPPRASVSVFS